MTNKNYHLTVSSFESDKSSINLSNKKIYRLFFEFAGSVFKEYSLNLRRLRLAEDEERKLELQTECDKLKCLFVELNGLLCDATTTEKMLQLAEALCMGNPPTNTDEDIFIQFGPVRFDLSINYDSFMNKQ